MTSKKSDQAERRSRAGSNNTTTYSTLLDHVEPEPGGRFAELSRREGGKATIIGTADARYPGGPEWTADPCGVEPSLGYSVNDLQPTGELHEVARAAEIAELAALEAPTADHSAAVVETGAANPTRRKLK